MDRAESIYRSNDTTVCYTTTMKFFVTGRSSNFATVEQAFARIKKLGHEVTFEWTALPMIKPYGENQRKAAEYADRAIKGVVEADVYVIFAHKDGNGVHTEFGAALAAHELKKKPRIYAIGTEQHIAMFNYHPAIQWKESLEAVLADCIQCI